MCKTEIKHPPMDQDNADYYRTMGHLYGYPDCCIEEFIVNTNEILHGEPDSRNEQQVSIAQKTNGYVPCKKHAKELSEGKVTFREIIRGRTEDIVGPFPSAR